MRPVGDADNSLYLSEAKEEDEIKKIALVNPNSFLHVFEYSQNSEVKVYSTIEQTGDRIYLCLRAPDAENFSRLNHEIDQIDRMKRYFEERNERELFDYDSILKLEDINGAADSKLNNLIKMSASYGAGKRLGAELKKVSVNKETNDGDEKTVNKMFNNKGKGKKFGANKQEDIKEEDDEDEDYKDSNQSSDSDESESKKSSNSSSDSSIKIKRKGKKSKNKKKSSSSSAEMGKSISSSSSKKSSKKIKSSSSNKSSNTIKSKSKSKEGSNGLKGPTLLPSAMFNSNSSPPREARRRASGYPDLQKEPEEIETKFQPSKDEPFAPKPRDSLSSMKPPLRKNLLLPPSTNY